MAAGTTGIDPNLFFKCHFSLPPLPAVAQKLLSMLQSGDANARAVAELLAGDPGLAAQILKIVNSAYYGLPSPIRDIKHAVAYLGLAEIERVVLTVAVMDKLAPEDHAEFERFWYHSFHTALCAKHLASKYGKKMDVEELHVAALLHDVGKLIYLKYFPDHFRRLSEYRNQHGVTFGDAEKALALPAHTDLGVTLAERWMLPDSVKDACRCHELADLCSLNAGEAEDDRMLTICLANVLSNLASEKLANTIKGSIREQTLLALDFDDEEFLLLMGELYELKTQVRNFLSQL